MTYDPSYGQPQQSGYGSGNDWQPPGGQPPGQMAVPPGGQPVGPMVASGGQWQTGQWSTPGAGGPLPAQPPGQKPDKRLKVLAVVVAALAVVALGLGGWALFAKPDRASAGQAASSKTAEPSQEPSEAPSQEPSEAPSQEPSEAPSQEPSEEPSQYPGPDLSDTVQVGAPETGYIEVPSNWAAHETDKSVGPLVSFSWTYGTSTVGLSGGTLPIPFLDAVTIMEETFADLCNGAYEIDATRDVAGLNATVFSCVGRDMSNIDAYVYDVDGNGKQLVFQSFVMSDESIEAIAESYTANADS